MFDIGWSELVVIGIVALIVIGPKELPGVLRSIGQAMGKVRRMAADFQSQFQEAMREAEVSDLKKTVDEATANFSTNFDPVSTARNEMESAFQTGTADKPAASEVPIESATPPIEPALPAPEPPVNIADFTPPDPEPPQPLPKAAGGQGA